MGLKAYKIALWLFITYSVWGHTADNSKILRIAFSAPETGFDPAKISDTYSASVTENIFDPLLTYDYLARPVKLIPNTIKALPTVSRDGKTYLFQIKPGIYFAPDPAFQTKKRELTANDYVYSFKRLLDPSVGSPSSYLVTDKFVGVDEFIRQAGRGKWDYDRPIPGIKALDRYTLQLTLSKPTPDLLFFLAMPQLGAVAREVIEAYANNTNAHPVGTGPYRLHEWKPGNRIVLERNPNFRHIVFHYPSDYTSQVVKKQAEAMANRNISSNGLDDEIAVAMNGKTMPPIDRIEISVIEEEQPAWLAFKSGQLDLVTIPETVIGQVLTTDPTFPGHVILKPDIARLGIRLFRRLDSEITFHVFNMRDPIVGGYAKEKIALRRAIAMAFPTDRTIAEIRRGQAIKMQYLIPNGVAGYNPYFHGATPYNPALANALLDQFGYRIAEEGWRVLPDGKPFVVHYLTGPTAMDKQWNEYWQKTFDTLKIRLNFQVVKWNEQIKLLRECQYGLAGSAWIADYPDGDNFMQLLYGKNIADSNVACYQSAAYDALYEKTQYMSDSPQRDHLYDIMNKIVIADTPWIFGDTRIRNRLTQRYIKGFKPHPVLQTEWRYLDIAQ